MNYLSAIETGINMIAGGAEGGILGSGNLPPPPIQVVPPPNYTPYYLLGFGALAALVLWK